MAFETGHPKDFVNKYYIILKHWIRFDENYKMLKMKKIELEHKNYDEISFDVIKRAPLLLLIIGLSISSLIFVVELIVYLNLITFCFIKG